MAKLTSHYPHTIDAKSRLTIPARLRASINPREEGYGFVAVSNIDKILSLYTPNHYDEISPEFDASSRTNPDVRNYELITYGLVENLEMDRMGRVLIPERLMEECGLSAREVVVAGVGDHIEVWPSDRWGPHIKKQKADLDALTKQALVHEKKKKKAPPPAEADST